MMERTDDGFVLSTGREYKLYVGCNWIPQMHQTMDAIDILGFTPEERAEIAAYFINEWLAWAVQEKDDEP